MHWSSTINDWYSPLAASLLESIFGRPFLNYPCIIHQDSLCGKVLSLQHVIVPDVKCVNKIRAKGLNRKQFREYCEQPDEEYGDLILQCELRWLSRGQVLKRFRKLRHIVHDFLEKKDELPKEKTLLCNEIWLLDLAFLVDVTSHVNYLNLKMQGKDKLFPSLANDISASMHSRWSWYCLSLSQKKEFKKNKVNFWKCCQLCKIHWKNQITTRGLW